MIVVFLIIRTVCHKFNLIAEDYVKINIERCPHRIIAKCRRQEMGRYKNPKVPINNRICNLCTDNVIEDEMPFLL